MDIKEKIESVVEKIKKDPSLAKKFKEDPVKTIESLIGIDLPDAQIKKVIDGVKAKLAVDQAGGLKDKFKKLF